MSATVEMLKCACGDCVCVVDATKGLEGEGRIHCGGACADHHAKGTGCNHAGCACHG